MATCRLVAFLAAGLSLCTCLCAFHMPAERESMRPLFLSDYNEKDTSRKSKRIRPIRLSSVDDKVNIRRMEAEGRREQALQDPTLLTSIRFSDRNEIHPATKRAILEVLGLHEMTQIQAETFAVAMQGVSVVGRARTGTGKTLAFLVPSLERLLLGDKELYIPGRMIGILVVAPTRELAQQIADQAALLLTYHSSDMTVACLYGGTKIQRDINLLSNQGRLPAILVATPGRLLEHLSETKIQGRKFCDILGATKIVVLDEMDCLLDMGFKNDVMKIMSHLPRKRQTLLFSATQPKSMRGVISNLLGKNYEEINCVNEKDVASLTNARVDQSYVILESMDDYVTSLLHIILHEIGRTKNYKIVIFLPTTKLVAFFADYMESGLGMSGIARLHSRMSHSSRKKTSHLFRSTPLPSILDTTDVSSRGVDYPDVSLVVQHGSPDSEDTYIHRLGRTGRAGKQGKGVQVVLPFEKKLIGKLRRRGMVETPELLQPPRDSQLMVGKPFLAIRSGDALLTPAAKGAYRSFLACYVERAPEFGIDVSEIVDAAGAFSRSVGLSREPGLDQKTAVRLGIEGLVTVVGKE
jgi:ATP-dependent RNA helicase MSS116